MSLIRYYTTECKLLLRGPGMYLMLATMAGILYFLIQTIDAKLDRAAYVINISEVYCMVAIIILPLLATAIARRDEEWKTASMMASFPYRTWEMEAARLLCALTLPLVAALVPMGTYAWLVINDGIPWGMREWYTCAVLASFAIPMLFAAVIAYLVGILIRKRYSYLISFVVLMGFSIIIPSLFTSTRPSLSSPPHTQVWFDYSLIKHIGNSYSRMWGFIYDPAFWLHRGMVAAIAAGMAMVVLLVVCRRRRERVRTWLVYPTMLVLGASLLWAGSAMYGRLQERVDIADVNEHFYRERLASANDTTQQRQLEQQIVAEVAAGKYTEADIDEMSRITINYKDGTTSKPLSVSHIKDLLAGMKFRDLHINSYKLELELLPRHGLKIQAKMHASNGQAEELDRFPIMLRHVFDVKELKVNNAAAAYEWDVATDVMWITPATVVMPGEHLEIEMTYSGTINDWRHYYFYAPSGDRWEQAAIVEENRLFLPAFYGWYPVIGNSRLSELLTHQFEGMALDKPRQAANILDTHLPRPMAGFEVVVTGPSGLKLFSNASVIASEQAGEKEATVTRLELDEASGLSLFGGDLQLVEATADGKTLRLLASGQLPAGSVEEAAQSAAKQYAEAARTLEMLDGEAATSFPQTITMALADYPYFSLDESSLRTRGMVDAASAGPEARDIHFLTAFSSSNYLGAIFGADIEKGKNGNIQLRTGQYWLDYSAKRREIRNARLSHLNEQHILNNLFQAYIERKVAGEESTDPLFEQSSIYFLNHTPNQVYDLMNTIYSKYGIESVYEVIKLVYDSIGTEPEQQIEDSNEQMEELLRGYLQRKTEGGK
ncbi:hypothetical protein G8C92_23015 [Paenibacillus donghaensis]|uniref:hypothetical protein n=1 Tax=Paenibacillus donghaensis TaxID=414771 RepID=UPI0018847BE7|nr:hypothetical protein [Paenibacillus donghaensis]MBE9916893.1 hypothetical protein [Paenibacillus donghaensis]